MIKKIKKTIYIWLMKLIINFIHTYETMFFTCEDCKLCQQCKQEKVCVDFYYKYINDDESRR